MFLFNIFFFHFKYFNPDKNVFLLINLLFIYVYVSCTFICIIHFILISVIYSCIIHHFSILETWLLQTFSICCINILYYCAIRHWLHWIALWQTWDKVTKEEFQFYHRSDERNFKFCLIKIQNTLTQLNLLLKGILMHRSKTYNQSKVIFSSRNKIEYDERSI